MNQEKFEIFTTELTNQMRRSHEENPERYYWSLVDLPKIMPLMFEAIKEGSFIKETPTFKRTCKALGIKHTYKAIDEYLEIVR